MKIIIVDDSVIIRERLVGLLAGIPMLEIIGQADNTLCATSLLIQHRPDVMILDIQMPGGSGLELLHQLREVEKAPIVMMLSSNSFPQYRKRCREAGADYFFDKSTEFEQLRETLYELVPQFTSPS